MFRKKGAKDILLTRDENIEVAKKINKAIDGSEERKLLKDFMEKMSKKNVPEVEIIKLNMMNERY